MPGQPEDLVQTGGEKFVTQVLHGGGLRRGVLNDPYFAAADRAIAAAGALLDQRFVVLVITDGEPTCSDDLEALERLPADWLARGIETHVMGLPGSEAAAALLDRIAKAGGTEQHQAIGTPDQLRSAVAAAL